MAHKWNHNFPKIAREAGFTIRELSTGHCIDWRFIASIDPYAIVGEKDYEKLDEFIPHLSEVPIGSVLQNRILDPAIGKYFILAQFSIQYLLFCKQFLDETIVEIRNSAQDVQRDNSRLEKMCRRKNEELSALHRKLQKVENQTQQMVYPCTKCTKNFISMELLNAHVARKHVELGTSTTNELKSGTNRKLSETDTHLINTIKLELEVKQLKERLNAAEKDLMDQRSREYHCHGCSREVRTGDRDQNDHCRSNIDHHNVGIQTNLEDTKDVNEQEVQTSKSEISPCVSTRASPSPTRHQLPPLDYISKTDLEAIVREQKEQFESWKALEREKFNQEIENVRQNMTDALRELEQRDRINATVASHNHSMLPVEQNPALDSIWKERYHELERMYQNSQKQVRETVENVELVYEDKIKQFERMMEQRALAVKKADASTNTLEQRSIELNVVEKDEEPLSSAILSEQTIIPKTEAEEALCIDEAIESNISSEETEEIESDEEIRTLETARRELLAREDASPTEKNLEKCNKLEKPPISPKKIIMSTFKSRLKGLGIDSKTRLLPKEDLNLASVVLAERRDANKKKNRNFFIMRNQLVAKVDQLARSKMGETIKQTSNLSTGNQPIESGKRESIALPVRPNIKSRSPLPSSTRKPSIEILPSKLKLTTADRLTVSSGSTANPFKVKPVLTSSSLVTVPEIKLTNDDVITVQAEINPIPDILPSSPVPLLRSTRKPEYERHLERLLETPVKRVRTPPESIITQEHKHERDDSDLSILLDAVPLQTKPPVPKKRVLFNLESKASNDTNLATGPSLSKAEDESDWNISSFEDEK
ncbi:cilium assembly protein DZIP1L-like [Topomyia yanbarensis]|uniref:cilium assembly protein DZIP1L-like n=1 Tax=Topomyia yanbarensis TaxID=2498891 RepID=UPI00273AE845|nr:cilium assembly protein DZIP1L-like [Topomyia yanbarensis]